MAAIITAPPPPGKRTIQPRTSKRRAKALDRTGLCVQLVGRGAAGERLRSMVRGSGMRPLRLLVVEGNTRTGEERYRAFVGRTPAEEYADVLRRLAPGAEVDRCFPARPDAGLPAAGAIAAYDGVALTGSALNIYERSPETERQVQFARAVFATGVPFFGSCWGLQVATVAAGGTVVRNPRGREIGVARRIELLDTDGRHGLHRGRPAIFAALCAHLDEVATRPPGMVVTAQNEVSAVQAAEIRHDGGRFWGTQFHSEFSFHSMAGILDDLGALLVEEGFFAAEAARAAHVADLRALHADPDRRDLAWRYGYGPQLLDAALRPTEIRNWLEQRVHPACSARGRA